MKTLALVFGFAASVAIAASGSWPPMTFGSSSPSIHTVATPLNMSSKAKAFEATQVIAMSQGLYLRSNAGTGGVEPGYASYDALRTGSNGAIDSIADMSGGGGDGYPEFTDDPSLSPNKSRIALMGVATNEYRTSFFVLSEAEGAQAEPVRPRDAAGRLFAIVDSKRQPTWLSEDVACVTAQVELYDGAESDKHTVCFDGRLPRGERGYIVTNTTSSEFYGEVWRIDQHVGCVSANPEPLEYGWEPYCFNTTDPGEVPTATLLVDLNPGSGDSNKLQGTRSGVFCAPYLCYVANVGQSDSKMACINVDTKAIAYTDSNGASTDNRHKQNKCMGQSHVYFSLGTHSRPSNYRMRMASGVTTRPVMTENGGYRRYVYSGTFYQAPGTEIVLMYTSYIISGTTYKYVAPIDELRSDVATLYYKKSNTAIRGRIIPYSQDSGLLMVYRDWGGAVRNGVGLVTAIRRPGQSPVMAEATAMRGKFGQRQPVVLEGLGKSTGSGFGHAYVWFNDDEDRLVVWSGDMADGPTYPLNVATGVVGSGIMAFVPPASGTSSSEPPLVMVTGASTSSSDKYPFGAGLVQVPFWDGSGALQQPTMNATIIGVGAGFESTEASVSSAAYFIAQDMTCLWDLETGEEQPPLKSARCVSSSFEGAINPFTDLPMHPADTRSSNMPHPLAAGAQSGVPIQGDDTSQLPVGVLFTLGTRASQRIFSFDGQHQPAEITHALPTGISLSQYTSMALVGGRYLCIGAGRDGAYGNEPVAIDTQTLEIGQPDLAPGSSSSSDPVQFFGVAGRYCVFLATNDGAAVGDELHAWDMHSLNSTGPKAIDLLPGPASYGFERSFNTQTMVFEYANETVFVAKYFRSSPQFVTGSSLVRLTPNATVDGEVAVTVADLQQYPQVAVVGDGKMFVVKAEGADILLNTHSLESGQQERQERFDTGLGIVMTITELQYLETHGRILMQSRSGLGNHMFVVDLETGTMAELLSSDQVRPAQRSTPTVLSSGWVCWADGTNEHEWGTEPQCWLGDLSDDGSRNVSGVILGDLSPEISGGTWSEVDGFLEKFDAQAEDGVGIVMKWSGLETTVVSAQVVLPSPSPTPSVTPSTTPSPTPSVSPSPSMTSSATPTPSMTSSATPTPSMTSSATSTPSMTSSATPTPSSSVSSSPTPSTTVSASPTSTSSSTPSSSPSTEPASSNEPLPVQADRPSIPAGPETKVCRPQSSTLLESDLALQVEMGAEGAATEHIDCQGALRVVAAAFAESQISEADQAVWAEPMGDGAVVRARVPVSSVEQATVVAETTAMVLRNQTLVEEVLADTAPAGALITFAPASEETVVLFGVPPDADSEDEGTSTLIIVAIAVAAVVVAAAAVYVACCGRLSCCGASKGRALPDEAAEDKLAKVAKKAAPAMAEAVQSHLSRGTTLNQYVARN